MLYLIELYTKDNADLADELEVKQCRYINEYPENGHHNIYNHT